MKTRFTGLTTRTAAAALVLMSAGSQASSHREAPNITKMPKVDATDFYMFSSYEASREDYVTILANYIPLQDAYGGPNYFTMDPAALYEIHIDNTGDAIEDLTFQFRFQNTLGGNAGAGVTVPVGGVDVAVPLRNIGGVSAGNDANLTTAEAYTLTVVEGARRSGTTTEIMNTAASSMSFTKPYDYVGNKTFTDSASYEAYASQYIYDVTLPNCSEPARVFVGQRKDPFAVNLGEVFDLVNFVPIEGAITQSVANDDLADKNVTTLALEVPKACLVGAGNGSIGGWTTASLQQARVLNPAPSFDKPEVNGGAWVQVSRLSNPLVNELVIGLPDKDLFNAAAPTQDGALATYVTNPTLPFLLNVLFGNNAIAPTNLPRTDLVAAFLTGFPGVNELATVTPSEMIRLNTAVAATPAASQAALGVAAGDLAGFPNGRRPGDDVVDIALRVVMGALCHDLPLPGGAANLGYCAPADAPSGTTAYTDGAPVNAAMFKIVFPYVNTPVAGSPN
ncbi:DUF4331 domain-containing protein [Allohahella marinimesophila]|uniref:DUF4331 domain-containing protein n=1 Tax=Allohahella marinimesophila TaxID=1054972 RepID=A0ABP7PNS9_9GAMM